MLSSYMELHSAGNEAFLLTDLVDFQFSSTIVASCTNHQVYYKFFYEDERKKMFLVVFSVKNKLIVALCIQGTGVLSVLVPGQQAYARGMVNAHNYFQLILGLGCLHG